MEIASVPKITNQTPQLRQQAPPIELHALDPKNNNILPLEDALVPVSSTGIQDKENDVPSFDIMELLNEVSDDKLVQAATQYEQHQMETKKSGTTVMQRE